MLWKSVPTGSMDHHKKIQSFAWPATTTCLTKRACLKQTSQWILVVTHLLLQTGFPALAGSLISIDLDLQWSFLCPYLKNPKSSTIVVENLFLVWGSLLDKRLSGSSAKNGKRILILEIWVWLYLIQCWNMSAVWVGPTPWMMLDLEPLACIRRFQDWTAPFQGEINNGLV